jgi:hypothetical protein
MVDNLEHKMLGKCRKSPPGDLRRVFSLLVTVPSWHAATVEPKNLKL